MQYPEKYSKTVQQLLVRLLPDLLGVKQRPCLWYPTQHCTIRYRKNATTCRGQRRTPGP